MQRMTAQALLSSEHDGKYKTIEFVACDLGTTHYWQVTNGKCRVENDRRLLTTDYPRNLMLRDFRNTHISPLGLALGLS